VPVSIWRSDCAELRMKMHGAAAAPCRSRARPVSPSGQTDAARFQARHTRLLNACIFSCSAADAREPDTLLRIFLKPQHRCHCTVSCPSW
jgi:hypothetical protein